MATQGERRALMFLAAVALLGAGTRAVRSRRVSVDTTALSKQIEAVSGNRAQGTGNGRKPKTVPRSPLPNPGSSIDLDVATADEIEKLPGIGPALAKRIVQDRDANGPFGCPAAFDRVKGVGPALLARIDSLATFSAAGGAPCASPAPQQAGRRPR